MKKTKLQLKTQTLRVLADTQLAVAGGDVSLILCGPTLTCATCPTVTCEGCPYRVPGRA